MAEKEVAPVVSARTLSGEEVLKIKKLPVVKPYSGETEGFKGKSYKQYAFGDKVFIVHEDDDFHEDYNKGNIKSIDIEITQNSEGKTVWGMNNYISWTKANGLKRNQAIHDAITPEMFKVQTMADYEQLA